MKKYLVVLVGIIFILVGGFLYYKNSNLIKNCTEEAEATVVDMEQDFSSDENGLTYTYYPIIEYNVGETIVRVTMDSGSNTPAYDINEKITILYNPNKVKEFIVKGDNTSNIFSIVFMALGVFVTGCGIKIALGKN